MVGSEVGRSWAEVPFVSEGLLSGMVVGAVVVVVWSDVGSGC